MKRSPDYLRDKTKNWVNAVLKEYELEEHHVKLLVLAAKSWDRCEEARELLDKEGLVYKNAAGEPRVHPAVKIENDNKTLFARLLRELCLDITEPDEKRPPRQY